MINRFRRIFLLVATTAILIGSGGAAHAQDVVSGLRGKKDVVFYQNQNLSGQVSRTLDYKTAKKLFKSKSVIVAGKGAKSVKILVEGSEYWVERKRVRITPQALKVGGCDRMAGVSLGASRGSGGSKCSN